MHHSNSFMSSCLLSPCYLPEWLSRSIPVSKYSGGTFYPSAQPSVKGYEGFLFSTSAGGAYVASMIFMHELRVPPAGPSAAVSYRVPKGSIWKSGYFYRLQSIAAASGCEKPSSAAIVECLREKTEEEILQAMLKLVCEITLFGFKWHFKFYCNRVCYLAVVILECEVTVISDLLDPLKSMLCYTSPEKCEQVTSLSFCMDFKLLVFCCHAVPGEWKDCRKYHSFSWRTWKLITILCHT